MSAAASGRAARVARVAVVTGASSGIGRAVALELARRGPRGEPGFALHLLGRDEERLEDVREAVRAEVGAGGEPDVGARVDVHPFDLTDDAALARFAEALDAPEVAALVHSAGVAELGRLDVQPVAALDLHHRVNVRAPYLLTQKLLPRLRAAAGQVVFVNSGAGERARAGWGQYAASKHALRALADALRDEEAEHGVRVTSVYPGRTASPMQRRVRAMENQPYEPEAFVQPDDVARALRLALELPPPAALTDLRIRPG